MIEKSKKTTKDLKKFIIDYKNGNIETEVVSNLIQPYHGQTNEDIKEYTDFWWMTNDKTVLGLTILFSSYEKSMLKENYGKHDFQFIGNRKYENYILQFDHLTLLVGGKNEVVIDSWTSKNKNLFIKELIAFDKEYKNMILKKVMACCDNLSPFEKKIFDEAKKINLINENNEVNYEYSSNVIKKTRKIKNG